MGFRDAQERRGRAPGRRPAPAKARGESQWPDFWPGCGCWCIAVPTCQGWRRQLGFSATLPAAVATGRGPCSRVAPHTADSSDPPGPGSGLRRPGPWRPLGGGPPGRPLGPAVLCDGSAAATLCGPSPPARLPRPPAMAELHALWSSSGDAGCDPGPALSLCSGLALPLLAMRAPEPAAPATSPTSLGTSPPLMASRPAHAGRPPVRVF